MGLRHEDSVYSRTKPTGYTWRVGHSNSEKTTKIMNHGTPDNAASSSTSSGKRKHGVVACSRAAPIGELRARAKKKRKMQHKPKTVSGNRDKASELIKWLVAQKQTKALTLSTDSEYNVKISSRYYWFNWGKLPELADQIQSFCESKGRKTAEETSESYSTLGKFHSAVAHFKKKAYEGHSYLRSGCRRL